MSSYTQPKKIIEKKYFKLFYSNYMSFSPNTEYKLFLNSNLLSKYITTSSINYTSSSIKNPLGLTQSYNRYLYFTNTINNNICSLDLETNQFLTYNLKSKYSCLTYNSKYNNKFDIGLYICDIINKYIIFISENQLSNNIINNYSIININFESYGIAFDNFGNLFLTENNGNKIKQILPFTYEVKTIATLPINNNMFGLIFDNNNNMYVVAKFDYTIYKLNYDKIRNEFENPILFINVGENSYPQYLAYDSNIDTMYITCNGSNIIYTIPNIQQIKDIDTPYIPSIIFSTSTNNPSGIALVNNLMYVTSWYYENNEDRYINGYTRLLDFNNILINKKGNYLLDIKENNTRIDNLDVIVYPKPQIINDCVKKKEHNNNIKRFFKKYINNSCKKDNYNIGIY